MQYPTSLLEYAEFYLQKGLSIIPLRPRDKRPAINSWKEYQTRKAAKEELTFWFGGKSHCNIAIVTGSISAIAVLDADSEEAVAWCEKNLPKTPTVQTMRGRHYYFRFRPGLKNSVKVNGLKLDVRAEGGYVATDPSVHETGVAYQWIAGRGLDDILLAEFPSELLAVKNDKSSTPNEVKPGYDTNYSQAALAAELVKLSAAVEGERNDNLNRSAFSLGSLVAGGVLDKRQVEADLLATAISIGLPEAEARATIKSGLDAGALEPRTAPKRGFEILPVTKIEADETTEASILAAATSLTPDSPPEDIEPIIAAATKNLRPIARQRLYEAIKEATGLPLSAIRQEAASVFKETEAEEPDHLELARKTIEAIEADNVISTEAHIWLWDGKGVWRDVDDRRIKIEIHNVLESSCLDVTQNRVNGVLDVFRTETFRDAHVWNVYEDTINVLNGELTLTPEGWRLCPHERENYRTTQLPVAYDPGADSPRFRQFLEEIFRGDADGPEKARALLEMIGYSLMSHARYERFILLVGNGANGKSVLLAVIRLLVGPVNCAAVQPSQFGNQFQRAHLNHKLANIVSELKEGAELEDDALKAIVSGEPTTVSHKFKDPFVMMPFATCWFGTNHLPHTNDFSDAMFRRALVVPFNRQFKPGVDADPHLKDKLAAELPGILNMALAAYADAMNRGTFTEPASCIEAKHAWRLEADQAAQFAEDAIEWITGERETSKAVFDAYKAWADANGVKRPLNRKNLTQRLERLGARTGKAHGGQRVLYGLRLRDGGVSGTFSQPIAYGKNTYIQNTQEIHTYSKNSKGTGVTPLTPPPSHDDAETVLEVLE